MNKMLFKNICYSPFRKGQSPIVKIYPTQKQIKQDLELIRKILDKNGQIRTYHMENTIGTIPLLVHQLGFKSLPGCTINKNRWQSKKEMDLLIELTKKGIAQRIIIGDMVLSRNVLPCNELISYLKNARARTCAKISTGNHWQAWLENPQLVEEVDFIAVGIYPHKQNIPLTKAIDYLDDVIKKIRKINPEKKEIVVDSGWPSINNTDDQFSYLKKFVDYAEKNNLEYFIFEAFDEEWKVIYDGKPGSHLGIFDSERRFKLKDRIAFEI